MNAGGGVGIWVREDINFETITSPFVEKTIETLTILLPDLEIIVINVYRPFKDRDAFMEQLTSHVSSLKDKYPKHDIICSGDFNIDLMKQNNQSESLIEEMISLGFIQQVTQATRQCDNTSSLIDHVYTCLLYTSPSPRDS